MIRVAYLHCPECAGERLYVLFEPPHDENVSECSACGHVWGYIEDVRIHYDPTTGTVRKVVAPRPALDPKVLAEGMAKVRSLEEARLLRNLGPDYMEHYNAHRRLLEGLQETDPSRRAALLNSHAPGLQRRQE